VFVVVVLCETDALAAGVIVAPAAGVVLAAAAGVVLAAAAGVVAAGLAVGFAVETGFAVAFVFGVEATLALGDALAVVVGAFEFLFRFFVRSNVSRVTSFFIVFGATVAVVVGAVVADFSAFVSVAGVFVLLDF
jgi:hypothetical protein